MENFSTSDQIVLDTVRCMAEQIASGHERAAHIRADIQAYVSENAVSTGGTVRGDLLTRLYWLFPRFVEYRPVADVLGVLPSSLRVAVGK